jgi:hypothetical protein
VRTKDADGVTDTGIGNTAKLWTAEFKTSHSGSMWTEQALLDANNQAVFAERPLLASSAAGERVLLFRRFGPAGTQGMLGQLAISRRMAGDAQYRPPAYISGDGYQHWMAAMTLNPLTNQVLWSDVRRAAVGQQVEKSGAALSLAPVETAAMQAQTIAVLSPTDDPVQAGLMAYGADPGLDAVLGLSEQHAAVGTPVTVTAMLRNLGREAASGMKISLYAGTAPGGALLAEQFPAGSLDFNQALTLTFHVTAGSGAQPVYAQVTGTDMNPGNNLATADLGMLPSPALISVAPAADGSATMVLGWMPPAVDGVLSYRILRSEQPGGPYELVGMAFGATSYNDLLLQRSRPYYYVVQAVDGSGVRSAYSNESGGEVAALSLYLPLITKK